MWSPAPPAAAAARTAGAALSPVLREAQGTTLASMRITDARGVIVASTGTDAGRSLSGQDEVRRALRGEPVSVMRTREHKATWVPEGISRGAMLRVFVALPVIEDGRVLGAVVLSRTPADIAQAVWGKRWELLALAAALLAVGTGLALAASRLITRPLGEVAAQAGRAAAGETATVAPVRRPGTREVAALSVAIARMADTLERRATYVRNLAAHIAHEFKTPLASARGAAELLSDHGGTMTEAERTRLLGVVEGGLDRLGLLTRRLLDLARADMMGGGAAGVVELEPALRRAAARFAGRVEVEVQPTAARATVAAEVLDGMLDGLLDNAAAHAGPGAVVQAGAERRDGRVLVRLADDGPGISPANQARVFEPFFTTARAQGGTGLGLPIVRALAAAAGGGVRLCPAAQGAVFVLDLPGA